MTTRTFQRTARTTIAMLGAAAMLAGCSILPRHAPVQLWRPPTHAITTARIHAHFSLRVDTPRTTGLLDERGIVVMPKPGQLSTYAGARWSKPPALLVRERLVDAFMAAGLPGVTAGADRFASDYVLSGDLRAFQTEYRAGSPVVVVRLNAQLRHGASRHLLAARSFVVTRQPQGGQVSQIVAAFGAADDQLAAQVVQWTLTTARATRPTGAL